MRQLVIDGRGTFDDLGLLLTEKSLPPPKPKSHYIDIPGGDGSIDLTDGFLGDVSYEDRQMGFEFILLGPVGDIEAYKRQLVGWLHGQRKDFALSFDSGYTYNGRFVVDVGTIGGSIDRISFDITARSYKLKEKVTLSVAAAGGVTVVLDSGRRRVCPTFSCKNETVIQMDGKTARLQPGTWKAREIWLSEGQNEVFLDSFTYSGDAKWTDLGLTLPWGGILGKRWAEVKWLTAPPSAGDDVIIQYDWEDL